MTKHLSLEVFIHIVAFPFFSAFAAAAASEEAISLFEWKATLRTRNNSVLSTWTLPSSKTSPCSTWYGVSCNSFGSVTRLNLSVSNVNGTLSRFPFSSLLNLTHINFAINGFYANIPAQIGNLSKLIYLDLSSNQLSGKIPQEIGKLTKLEVLHLVENQLNVEQLALQKFKFFRGPHIQCMSGTRCNPNKTNKQTTSHDKWAQNAILRYSHH
ncbi:MDIS1-interacting receptor like kinase 2-like [Heracleum sosnowskyi]|uniref:MDIS1-interacting receptor like kinase 2-like n=1 Tax=Heracleum sosnowskyi TaxID=360622 RepID=A0AAD8N017_9APIA|nr:MDIS1-interacting receptor like kinase 2-like [Heracleum sosnowskyi]